MKRWKEAVLSFLLSFFFHFPIVKSYLESHGIGILRETWNYSMKEQFWLERTLRTIQFQLLCNGQGHLPLDQAAQGPSQPGLEHLQE